MFRHSFYFARCLRFPTALISLPSKSDNACTCSDSHYGTIAFESITNLMRNIKFVLKGQVILLRLWTSRGFWGFGWTAWWWRNAGLAAGDRRGLRGTSGSRCWECGRSDGVWILVVLHTLPHMLLQCAGHWEGHVTEFAVIDIFSTADREFSCGASVLNFVRMRRSTRYSGKVFRQCVTACVPLDWSSSWKPSRRIHKYHSWLCFLLVSWVWVERGDHSSGDSVGGGSANLVLFHFLVAYCRYPSWRHSRQVHFHVAHGVVV